MSDLLKDIFANKKIIADIFILKWGGSLKNYLVILFQLIVWSGYTLVEWLSVNDRFVFKVFMFLVFSYLAIYIGKMILKSNRRTMLVTVISLLCYGILQILLETLVPVY